MNKLERRIFLTKDEVKQLGTELTSEITEPIKVLYLPILDLSGANEDKVTFDITFKYWDSSVNQVFTCNDVVNSSYLVVNDNNSCRISLTDEYISCKYINALNGKSYNKIDTLYYGELHGLYTVLGTYSTVSQVRMPIYDHTDGSEDIYYIRIDVTKLMKGHNRLVGRFFLKYLSGTIPPDTIFYEPGTYE